MEADAKPVRYFYLIDNNVFRTLCTSPRGSALVAMNHAIRRHPLLGTGDFATAFKMTPFTLLEAIGVLPPQLKSLPIPAALVTSGDTNTILASLLVQAEEQYASVESLQPAALRRRAEEQRKYVTSEASILYDICVTDIVSASGFEDYVYRCLAIDYIYKYPYPRVIWPAILRHLIVSLFAFDDLSAGLSKYRIVKRLWDAAYDKLRRTFPTQRGDLDRVHHSMRLKTHRDFVDCELIHYLLFGYNHDNRSVPVVGFTADDPGVVGARLHAYRTVLTTVFYQRLDEQARAAASARIGQRSPGIMIACRPDGTFVDSFELPSEILYSPELLTEAGGDAER